MTKTKALRMSFFLPLFSSRGGPSKDDDDDQGKKNET